MKKIIFMLLVTTSAMSFAKAEEPKVKTEESKSKVETVLVGKKNFKDEKSEIKIAKKLNQAKMNLEGCIAIASYVGSYDPPLGAAMMADCVHR